MKKFLPFFLSAMLIVAICLSATFAENDVFELTIERVENEETDDGWVAAPVNPDEVFEPNSVVTFRIHYNVPQKADLEAATGVVDGELSLNINFTNLKDLTAVYMWTKICDEEAGTCMIFKDFDRLHMNGSTSATVDLQTYQGGYIVFQGKVNERAVTGMDISLAHGTYSEAAEFYINTSLLPTPTPIPTATPIPTPTPSPSGTPTSPVPPVLGDVNLDGELNTGDAAALLQYFVELMQLNDTQLSLADINQDGVINTGDAAYILMIAAGLI